MLSTEQTSLEAGNSPQRVRCVLCKLKDLSSTPGTGLGDIYLPTYLEWSPHAQIPKRERD